MFSGGLERDQWYEMNELSFFNPVSANPTKWSNTLSSSAFAGELFECVTIL